MSRLVRTVAPGLVTALLIAGCGYKQTIRHPKLAQLAPIETTMNCMQIDLAVDRAETVRWVIRDDGGRLETSGRRSARQAGNFVLIPMSVLGGSPVAMDDGGHAVLNAADGRIRELLQLKRDRGCPPRPTALGGLDDLAVLAAVAAVQAQLDAGNDDEAGLYAERTRLLDGLRAVSPPAESR